MHDGKWKFSRYRQETTQKSLFHLATQDLYSRLLAHLNRGGGVTLDIYNITHNLATWSHRQDRHHTSSGRRTVHHCSLRMRHGHGIHQSTIVSVTDETAKPLSCSFSVR
jgi:hypothetical protein